MIYGSVCSGIEAATVAWAPLGWRPAFFAEIDAFPSAVLAHRFPEVRNLGDFTAIRNRWLRIIGVEAIDLLVVGVECISVLTPHLVKDRDGGDALSGGEPMTRIARTLHRRFDELPEPVRLLTFLFAIGTLFLAMAQPMSEGMRLLGAAVLITAVFSRDSYLRGKG